MFSPHTRGCSPALDCVAQILIVFPAYTGMFRKPRKWSFTSTSFPRIRGDVPEDPYAESGYWGFSPHTRGCSDVCGYGEVRIEVFPAYAGMFLIATHAHAIIPRFPRIRGDVPDDQEIDLNRAMFSPHTRGCSYRIPVRKLRFRVFPAYAGMFRSTLCPWCR